MLIKWAKFDESITSAHRGKKIVVCEKAIKDKFRVKNSRLSCDSSPELGGYAYLHNNGEYKVCSCLAADEQKENNQHKKPTFL
uniref:SCP domain-containing protein n=1 Tax=Ascaris lumbricoides TaxID=6252 RepID=A0A0M3HVV8_ASCLU